MFRQLGLRHLAVLGMDGCLAGILTRKDLILASEADSERCECWEEEDSETSQILESEEEGGA